MKEHIFDIVDAQDQVISAAPRSVVHAQKLLHRAAHIWLFNAQGQLLIQLRSPHKDKHPSTWDSSACGHVDSGENYPTAARRETCEELGLTLALAPPLEEIAYCQNTAALGHEFVRVYFGQSEGPFDPQTSEVAELRWIAPHALGVEMKTEPHQFAPSFIYLWETYSETALAKI